MNPKLETYAKALIDASDIGIVVIDRQHRIIQWNRWMANHSDCQGDSLMGENLFLAFPGLQGTGIQSAAEAALKFDQSSLLTSRLTSPVFPLYEKNSQGDHENKLDQLIRVKPIKSLANNRLCLFEIIDSTHSESRERQLKQQASDLERLMANLRKSEHWHKTILNTTLDAIITYNKQGSITSANRATELLFGQSGAELHGQALTSLLPLVQYQENNKTLNKAFCLEDAFKSGSTQEIIGQHQSGKPLNLSVTINSSPSDGQAVYVASIQDISSRKQSEEKIYYMAHHDNLTGLPNRVLFLDQLDWALAQAGRTNSAVAIMMLDLDRFKIINDTMGHGAGDQLLQQTAKRLQQCVRRSDTVARLGGDEFAIIQTNIRNQNHTMSLAKKIVNTFANYFDIDGHRMYSTTSIGITIYPSDADNRDQLIKNADIAMYQAKSEGRNKFQYYSSKMHEKARHRLQLEKLLRAAIENREFSLHFQPEVEISRNQSICLETLIRWNHPEHGLIPPDQFIPVAEECGLIIDIGCWVLDEACKLSRQWSGTWLESMPLAVNVSAVELRQSGFFKQVYQTLNRHRISPDRFELEITETALLEQHFDVARTLDMLNELGVVLTLDDFGTGFSSLSYLKKYPIKKIKVDRNFVSGIGQSKDDEAIVSAVLGLGHSLDLAVIAEGVETEEQLEFLRYQGCELAQGYYYSKPLAANELRSRNPMCANQSSLPCQSMIT